MFSLRFHYRLISNLRPEEQEGFYLRFMGMTFVWNLVLESTNAISPFPLFHQLACQMAGGGGTSK